MPGSNCSCRKRAGLWLLSRAVSPHHASTAPPLGAAHMIPTRFPATDIVSLVGAPPRHDLAESFGPSLSAAELLRGAAGALDGPGGLTLGYGSAAGDATL